MSGRRRQQFGVLGHGHDAAEGGVDVSEVVLQRRDLLGVLLRGEDLRGELRQLRETTAHQGGLRVSDRSGATQQTHLRPGDGDGDLI